MNYNSYNYGNEMEGCQNSLKWLIGIVALFFCVFGQPIFFSDDLYVTDEKAIAYIEDMTGANRVEIIVDDGNEFYLVHDMEDVTFDVWLYFEDKPRERAQFRCTDGWFRDMVCRGYTED